MNQFKVATANTLLGQASKDISNLGELLNADILLLQEVISPSNDNLKQQLEEAGFQLVTAIGKFGLAIAVRKNGEFTSADSDVRSRSFERLSWLERFLVKVLAKQDNEFAERGMVAAKLVSKHGKELTVVNVHPGISFASKRIRSRQIEILSQELKDPYYEGALLVAGDMNHYPKPESIDEEMASSNHLTSVNLADKPTWIAKGSHYERFARLQILFNHKSLADYDGQLDAMLYRADHLRELHTDVIEIQSDHRAIMTVFSLDVRAK
jgi:endonuclease/exonuclease/phosphatase family metal-dependent hydrolase